MTPSPAPEMLSRTAAYSRWLAARLNARPELGDCLLETLATPVTRQEMNDFLATGIAGEADLKRRLRRLRERVFARVMARDLNGLADLPEVTRTLTDLAEVTVRAAVDFHHRDLAGIHGEPLDSAGRAQQLIVVGMGKLGGGELNASSDIDLIFVFPEEGDTAGPRCLSNFEFFTRLGKRVINALDDKTEDGHVFRVDMRLRPYGDGGPLVSSFAMLESYFYTQAREWERYAWIKGRALTGDRISELEKLRLPFVFRKYLDFGSFGSMRELHAQIRREVARKDKVDNIKLGPGGIREIEFITQVFQLIRGGKEPALQTRSTLQAMSLIAQRELMQPQAVAELRAAYFFLRNLEHRLQYLEDAQTQTLPGNDGDRQLIAEAMNFANWEDFYTALNAHRQKVTRHFEQVFAAPQSQQQSHPLTALWQGHLADDEAVGQLAELGYSNGEDTWQRLARMRQGNRYAQLPETSRTRFDALLPPLIQVAAGFPNPDETLERILKLLENISRRAAYLALLLEYPQTLSQVARLCSASPWVSDYLTQHPILLDELLDSRSLHTPPDCTRSRAELRELLDAANGDTERQMDILRHFKQAQVFRLVAQDLAGILPLEKLSDHLSDLADLILGETLRLCWQGLRIRHREEP
ncbi:MAG: bifunctional [glutamate--ammonia ligase]-adenylyl-L-tyrosine phosphorylase/[glutamate--ammonia-ligase] adenylyltransferase, partial [Pseudomonadota bacterium]|nr:bifunctional [glutamate--ammonia ligase]-adenylyl-L-tyrosine phosphorylase/[glutamate--ammonia-ligase] adenylyltransferase [Pseudomonadota bacterium]